MNSSRQPTIEVLAPRCERDRGVPQYYVWGTDDGASIGLYWILDSTRDDQVVAGPLKLEQANVAVIQLNEAALKIEKGEVDRAEVQITAGEIPNRREFGIKGNRRGPCLITIGTRSNTEVV